MLLGLLLSQIYAANAGDDVADDVVGESLEVERKVHLVPVHADFRVPFRQDLRSGPIAAVGVELARRGRSSIDLDLSYASGRLLLVGGIFRTFEAGQAVFETDTRLSRWLGFGALAGAELRNFRQQFSDIDQQILPVVGLRLDSGIVSARWWAVDVVARGTTDLMFTRLVLESRRVVMLSPYEAQLGLRVVVGQRSAGVTR